MIALLDSMSPDPDLEPDADLELDAVDSGIGDKDGLWEQGHLAGRGIEAGCLIKCADTVAVAFEVRL